MIERYCYLYILSLKHYALLWCYKRMIFMGDLPFWNYLGIPGAVNILKVLNLVDGEGVISALAEIFDVYGLQCKQANTLLSSLGCFNCILRLHSTAGYVWSQCVLKKDVTVLQSKRLCCILMQTAQALKKITCCYGHKRIPPLFPPSHLPPTFVNMLLLLLAI